MGQYNSYDVTATMLIPVTATSTMVTITYSEGSLDKLLGLALW